MVKNLTKEGFLSEIFNFEKSTEWKYEGTKPCIIDFYADWCAPCKATTPILDELAKEFEGKLDVYKVDTEAEQELAAVFGIRSIPTFLLVPLGGQPQMVVGAMPKDSFVKAIKEVLDVTI